MNTTCWLSSTDPQAMLTSLRDREVSERKLRLFAVACVRRVWLVLTKRKREAIRVAERYADGKVTLPRLKTAHRISDLAGATFLPGTDDPLRFVQRTAAFCVRASRTEAPDVWDAAPGPPSAEERYQANLLRDIFRDQDWDVTVKPDWLAWQGGTVVRLAESLYQQRAFDALPYLADALEEAGCDVVPLLGHLRKPRLHVRGCWALDLALGKT